ncbi:unnamed protein product [Microthlaspi erraticum]|uniref:Uncharacterized protein n=1 Tax=Microthlaspi erraticum TaxID=1685480 RepID=A0A6D2JIF1_9BRAS|nr:unnamed protein product [Microthlaspi erraticum]
MWCVVPIGYNSSYPLRCWVLLSDWSALDPIRFCISPLASHPLLKLILSLSSWVSLPDSIRSSWSLSTPSLLFSSWCRCPIGLGLLRLHSVAGCCYMKFLAPSE